jgi:hypothetical protein
MNRTRRRRVTSEEELLQANDKQTGGIFGSKGQQKLHFMEEVDYTMELSTAS